MVLQQIDRNVNLTSQVLVDTALASKSERMEHDGATYSARTVESKGRTYTKLTINDTKTMRKHRYFISFIKAIGRAVKRLFQRKSIRPYLDGRTAHLRSQLTDTDRKALKAVKVCGTLPDEKLGESENYGIHTASIGITDRIHMASMVNSILKDFGVQSEVAPNDTPLEEPGIGEFDSWPAQAEGASKGTASLDNGIDLEAGSLDGDVDLSDWGVVGEQETIVDYPVENLVPENGFYEVQLATCIQGIIKEPHVVSLVIDPHHKQFYLMDTKGTNPENLHFYYGSQGNRRVSELTVDDLVGAP